MNALETLLRQASVLFKRQNQAWALVGGMAISVRTEPRFTRDLDVAVSVADDLQAEALIRILQGNGFSANTILQQDATKRLATVRLVPTSPSSSGLMLDILFASSGIEQEICASAENIEVFPQLYVPVATVHHLIVLKLLARDDRTRPQDVSDLRQLLLTATDEDLVRARAAAELVETRGYARDRNLADALTVACRELRDPRP